MDIFDSAETLDRESLEALQLERLRDTVARAADAPAYRGKLIDPSSIRSLDDVRRLPLTSKDDLRAGYPDQFLCRPHADMVRLHTSSGTTGTPTAVFHTKADIDTWASLMARCMHMAGMRPADVFQNCSGYGLFTGGLGIHYGAERLGCLTIPAGAGNSRRQIRLMQDFGVTAIHIVPSYALHLASFIEKEGIDPRSLALRIALIGAEPHTEEARRRIEEAFAIKAFNSYGLSEMNGPGVAFECAEQNGMHVWEDAYLFEILNPETGEPVPDGELGELVMTTLAREGMPLIRYRTRDLTRVLPGACPCGRVHRRIDRIAGRADDMMIVKGCNIYPMQIEEVLLATPGVGRNYVIILQREDFVDQIRIEVEMSAEVLSQGEEAMEHVRRHLVSRLREEILVTPRVVLLAPDSLPQSEGKAMRVRDLREPD